MNALQFNLEGVREICRKLWGTCVVIILWAYNKQIFKSKVYN